jgi:pimeloyl-ACP methyl ester carboxylesterase
LPGHGDRLDQPCGVLSGRNTVSSALDFLRQHAGVDPERIGLMGVSLGGALSIHALAAGQRVKALALLEVPCSLSVTKQLWWREALSAISIPTLNIFRDCSLGGLKRIWSPASRFSCSLEEMFDQLRPDEVISELPSLPLLIVGGGRDPIAPIAHSNRLFRRANEPKTQHIIEPASHVTLIFMAKTVNLVTDWFAEVL